MKKSHTTEILACLVVLLAVVLAAAFPFREWKKKEDRKRCIINLRNVEQAARGYLNMNSTITSAPISANEMWKTIFIGPDAFLPKPRCPSGGIYTFNNPTSNNPPPGFIFCTCSHAESLNHIPEEVTEIY